MQTEVEKELPIPHGVSPSLRALKGSCLKSNSSPQLTSFTPPDEASKEEDPEGGQVRKRKMVSFAEFTNEPQGIMDNTVEEEDDEEEIPSEHPSPFLALRYKRSASLPHIELNQKLTKKIKKMMEQEQDEKEENLESLLEGKLKFEEQEEEDHSQSKLRFEYEFHSGQLLQVRIGDITEECVDIIVNEANSNLMHNLGVAGAIAQKGGKDIQQQCDRWIRKYGVVPPGKIAITEGGTLHAKHVIHAVGPIWRGGNSNEDHEYCAAVERALRWAHKNKCRSVAIPALGVGFLGFPKERCSYLLVDCIAQFFARYPKSKLRQVRLVNIDNEITEALVFEMVGKFTSGCETSESERSDLSGNEMDDDAEEDEEEEEDDEDDEEDNTTESKEMDHVEKPMIMGPVNIFPKDRRGALAWNRRQSIA